LTGEGWGRAGGGHISPPGGPVCTAGWPGSHFSPPGGPVFTFHFSTTGEGPGKWWQHHTSHRPAARFAPPGGPVLTQQVKGLAGKVVAGSDTQTKPRSVIIFPGES